jgi:hypothetical protein
MTRKDYVLIATAIAQAASETTDAKVIDGMNRVTEHLCHALMVENPMFNTQKFVKYIQTKIRELVR